MKNVLAVVLSVAYTVHTNTIFSYFYFLSNHKYFYTMHHCTMFITFFSFNQRKNINAT